MNSTTAEAAGIALEAIMLLAGSRNSVTSRDRSSFSVFEANDTRNDATDVALESIKGMAKKVWDTIVKAYKKVVDIIKRTFRKIMDFFTSGEKKITSLRKTINDLNIKDIKLKRDKVNVKFAVMIGIIASNSENTKVPSLLKGPGTLSLAKKLFPSSGEKACMLAGMVFKNVSIVVDGVTKFVDNCESNPKLDKATIGKLFNSEVVVPLEKLGLVSDKGLDNESEKGATYFGPFDRFSMIKIKVDEESGRVEVNAAKPRFSEDLAVEVPVLSKSDMYKMLDSAADLTKLSASGKTLIKANEKALQSIMKASASAQKMTDQNDYGKSEVAKTLEKAIRSSINLNNKLGLYSLSMVNSTLKGVLKWVELSIEEYNNSKE